MENWKPVVGHESYYEISDLGNLRSLDRYVRHSKNGLKMIKSRPITPAYVNGYQRVSLTADGLSKNCFIHRLVALAFIPNPNNYPCVNHIDGNRKNNTSTNLEWCTVMANNHHALNTNLKPRISVEYTRPIAAINISTGEEIVFPSINDAARYIGEKSGGSIYGFLKGDRSHVKGFIFKDLSKKDSENIKLLEKIIARCQDAISGLKRVAA